MVAAAIFTLTVSAVQTSAQAGDSTTANNFSVQFNPQTGFYHQISHLTTLQNDIYGAYLVMPPCVGTVKNDCIVSLEHTNSQGKWVKGKFKEYLPLKDLKWNDSDLEKDYNSLEDTVFAKARPELDIPAGGRTGIWQLSNAKHAGGTDYAITISFAGATSSTSKPRDAGNLISWNPNNDGLRMMLSPISYDVNLPMAKENVTWGKGIDGRISCTASLGKATYRCVPSSLHSFPPKTKYRITVNFKSTKSVLNGQDWYIGRLFNAQVRETSNSDDSVSLAIEGSPTMVGGAETEFPKNQTNFQMFKGIYDSYYELLMGKKPFGFENFEAFNRFDGFGFSTLDPGAASAWNILEDSFDFKYFSEQETWQVSTSQLALADRELTKNCASNDVLPGIISTNAIVANPSPPKWSAETSELVYSIASPHLKKDGSLNSGVYELTIDKKLAECLWGLDPLKYRATISVTAKDGTQKLSTTVFASTDKHLTFRAAGFSFSTSLIKVKLSNEKGSTAVKTALPDIFLKTSAKRTTVAITCVKGKIIKKVSGTSPKCPAGYKKK